MKKLCSIVIVSLFLLNGYAATPNKTMVEQNNRFNKVLNLFSSMRNDFKNTEFHNKYYDLIKKVQVLKIDKDSEIQNVLENVLNFEKQSIEQEFLTNTQKDRLYNTFRNLDKLIKEMKEQAPVIEEAARQMIKDQMGQGKNSDAVLTSLSTSNKTEQKIQNNKSVKVKGAKDMFDLSHIGLGLALAGACVINIYLYRRKNKLASDVASLKAIDHTQEIYEAQNDIENSSFKMIKGVGIIKLNSEGTVEFLNTDAKNAFGNIVGSNWDQYFVSNFKKEEGLKTVNTFYKNVSDVSDDWMFESNTPRKGKTVVTFKRIESRVITALSKSRNEVLESSKVLINDIVESIVLQKKSYWKRDIINVKESSYLSDCYFYGNEKDASQLVQLVLDVTSLLCRFKGENQASFEMKRDKKKMKFFVDIENLSLSAEDFNRVVRWNGQKINLSDLLKKIDNVSNNMNITTIVKNYSMDNRRGLKLEINVNDNESLKWYTFNYKVEQVC